MNILEKLERGKKEMNCFTGNCFFFVPTVEASRENKRALHSGRHEQKKRKPNPVVPHQASVTQPFMAAPCRKVWRTAAEYAI